MSELMRENEQLLLDANRHEWWRENFQLLLEDDDGIEGWAFSCQIPIHVIQISTPAALYDMVADYEIAAALEAK